MATRGKFSRRKPRRLRAKQKPAAREATPSQQEQVTAQADRSAQAEPAPAEEPEAKPTIRKGIYLSALIYVEGDMPAPDDFIGPATNALKPVLEQALKGEHDGLSMALKKVEVRNDVEQEAEEGEGEEQPEEKFQF